MIILPLLPYIAFFFLLLFLVAYRVSDKQGDGVWQEFFIQTFLIWSGYLTIGFELLSLFRGLTTTRVVFLWLFSIFILLFLHLKHQTFTVGWKRLKSFFTNLRLSLFDVVALVVIGLTLLILLITGVMSPPNIHDVLSYHMARVMHWAQNRTLAFYPTVNSWQLWMPPFSELSQLNWQLLSGSDVLSSLYNWFSLIFIMVSVSGVAKYLGAKRRGQFLSAMFVMTLPIVVLQASGAKNDIVLSFLISAILFYAVKATYTRLSYFDFFVCSIAFGLGILTKGTFIVFVAPLLVWLFFVTLKQHGWNPTLIFAVLGLVTTIILNGGHWIRNTLTFGSPIFSGQESFLINARFGLDVVISNLSKHVAVQLNGKYGFINEGVQTGLRYIHSWLNMPLFDPTITLGPREFYYVPTREEVAGNTFHFILTGFVLIVGLFGLINKEGRRNHLTSVFLILAALSGVILFSAVFRWQTWGTRFFIPYYVLFAPAFGYVFGRMFPSLLSWFAGIILVVIMFNPLLNNHSRSFSWAEENRNSIWRLSRRGLLFANNSHIEGAVLELTHTMEVSGCRSYGMILRTNGPEYLLWGALKPTPGDYYLEHIEVNNITARHSSDNFDPCGIVFFEVTPSNENFDLEYQLVKQWQIGEEILFTLLLKPSFDIND